jgi:RHS repeat-associated protein
MPGYAHDANHRMRASPGHTYDYDDDGNLVAQDPNTAAGRKYVWAEDNTLKAFSVQPSTSANYVEDPFARRLSRVSGTTSWYLWDGDSILSEYSASGARQKRYEYAASWQVPSRIDVGGARYSVHFDYLGTTRLVIDASQLVAWQAAYTAFGAAITAGSLSITARFPGQQADDESELHQNRYRYYDPVVGRYIAADPLGEFAGINVYLYARNSPATLTDFFGLDEGSPSNLQKRRAIAAWAIAQDGKKTFSVDAHYSSQYPAGSNKCSAFTCAAAEAGHAPTTVTVFDGEGTKVDRCPTAAELARGNIPNWRLLKDNETPRPGDILANPLPDPVANATGHAAVVTPSDNERGWTTEGAHNDRVGPPGRDATVGAVFRRYIGD